jgi:isoquinoline 1-oxidoreductase beta subunit
MARTTQTRREFLQTSATLSASLLIGFHLPASRATFKPNAWLEVHPDGSVSIWTGRSEMGQGVKTAMPMIVAEELDVEWQSVRVIQADANPAYGNQMTVGSRSVQSGWEPLRKAGAAAREMLISAAALTWNVPREGCRSERGAVRHAASDRQLRYGQLVERAASLPLPENPPLKPSSEFRIVGTRVPRVDTTD